MKLFYSMLSVVFVVYNALGQSTYTLAGRITDVENSTALIGANVVAEGSLKGVISDLNGFYTIKLPAGKQIIQISYIGYTSYTDTIYLTGNLKKDFNLEINTIVGKEIVITTRDVKKNVESTSTSIIELNAKEIKQLPSLMGESDLLRLIQLTPGIQSANEGNSGFYVRGGAADQNLVLLDNTLVYNPSHVLGFFSVFNSDVVRDVRLIKSGMEAEYGGRMSSVVDVHTLEGRNTGIGVTGTLGLIFSKIMFEGPLVKNRITFQLAGRRTYIDEILKPAIRPFVNSNSSFYTSSKYYFYDLNGKISVKISDRDRLDLTAYLGKDSYQLDQKSLDYNNSMNWGNTLLSSTYNRIINENWYLEATAGYTHYEFNFDASQVHVNIAMQSIAEDAGGKITLKRVQPGKNLYFGVDYKYHHFVPNNLNAVSNGLKLNFGPDRDLYANETALFYNQEYDITPNLSLNAGLRFSNYLQMGPYTEFIKDEAGIVSDTLFYQPNQIIESYNNIEPRITIRYQIESQSSIKTSYTRHVQYIHQASASSITLPTDVWLPSSKNLKPQKSDHITLGYYRNLSKNKYTASIELYYKQLYNQIELLYGIIHDFQDKIFEESMAFGNGRAYGTELYIRKVSGSLTGWVGYTLSRTERSFEEIDEGSVFPAKYDRTHDLTFVFNYALNNRWSLSATFIYATGNAMTIPAGKYIMDGNLITVYSRPNSFRMPAYHRLDLSANYYFKKMGGYESYLNFSIFNAYNRSNPYFIYFEITGNVYEYNLKITPRQVTLFPIIPSISYTFKF